MGTVTLMVLAVCYARAQDKSVANLRTSTFKPVSKSPLQSALILDSFVRTEKQVRDALNQHTFKRDVLLQTIGPNGAVTGEYIRNSKFLFDDRGNRIERVLYHPPSTIRTMKITNEDIQDLAGSQLIGFDVLEISKYQLSLVGEVTLDSQPVYELSVQPVVKPNARKMSERFFCGTVWIDPNTFQVLKVRGVVEPQGNQRFPVFQTWREPLAGKVRLPVRTEADDVLRFPSGNVNYRIRVKYYDYKTFGSKLTISDIDDPHQH